GEIRLPIFELTELFARAVGGETDIVSKEMYSFEDRQRQFPNLDDLGKLEQFLRAVEDAYKTGEIPQTPWNKGMIERVRLAFNSFRDTRDELETTPDPSIEKFQEYAHYSFSASHWAHLTKLGDEISLRPEATASVCRAYIEHGMQALTQPVKLYYMGPMFRRERPQKGRYRQFYQIGAEALEAEVIEMVMTYFARLGLEGVQLDINSIGHSAPDCRRGYVEKLKSALEK